MSYNPNRPGSRFEFPDHTSRTLVRRRFVPRVEAALEPRQVRLTASRQPDPIMGQIVTVLVTCGYPGPRLQPGSELGMFNQTSYVSIQHHQGRPYAIEFRIPVDIKWEDRFWTRVEVTCHPWASDFFGQLRRSILGIYDACKSGVPAERCVLVVDLPPYVGFYHALVALHGLVGDKRPPAALITSWIAWWSTPDADTHRLRGDAQSHIAWLEAMKRGSR